MSSSALQLPQYKSNTPFRLIGVALIVLALAGGIYSVIPQAAKTAEFDLGTILRTPGRLTVAWPNAVLTGWPNVCEIRYEPTSSGADGDVQAAFFLTSAVGISDEALGSSLNRSIVKHRYGVFHLNRQEKQEHPYLQS